MQTGSLGEVVYPVGIVECGPRHGAALKLHRVKLRHRRNDPRAPHLGYEFPQRCPGLCLAELHGHRPAGRPLGMPHSLLQGQVVQLDHHPVRSMGEVVTLKIPVLVKSAHVHQAVAEPGMGVGFEAGSPQPLQGRQLLAGLGLLRGEVQTVGQKIHLATSHHLGVQLAQGARTGIAGIGKGGLVLLAALAVDGGKGGLRQKRLATDFRPGRRVRTAQPQGDGANGADTGGDFLAPVTVPPGGPPHQQTMFIPQGQGYPVHLQFTGIGQGLVRGGAKMAPQPLLPLRQLLHGKDVVQAEERNGVDDTGQAGFHRLPHPLGGAVRLRQLGMALLQVQQFPIEAVVLLIREDGFRQHVIGVAGLIEPLPQGFRPGLGLGRGWGRQAHSGEAPCLKA